MLDSQYYNKTMVSFFYLASLLLNPYARTLFMTHNASPLDNITMSMFSTSILSKRRSHEEGALTQHLHNTYTTLTQHLHNTYTTLTQHLHNTYTTLTQHLHNTYTTLTQHLHNTYTTLTQHLRNTYATLTQHLRNTYATLTQHLHNLVLLKTQVTVILSDSQTESVSTVH